MSSSKSTATEQAKAALDAAVKRGVSERTLDRYRVVWQLNILVERGVLRDFYHSGGVGWMINAQPSQAAVSERRYHTTRELEAFVHGAFAALETSKS